MKYEKWSFGYFLLKVYVKTAYRLVHKRISIVGKEKLPKGKPVIFAPNHQNALCDPLAVLCNLPYQPVWLARADIFKNKYAREILRFLKIMPVYRLRDGKENLSKNDTTFNDSVKVLENNFALALFPEAAHSGNRQMLPHKKAVPRIAFMAEEKTNFSLDTQIVPVGIYYSHYWKFDRDLFVQIGDPVPVKDFEEVYKGNTHNATLAFRDRIYNSLEPLVVNFKTKNFYEEFEFLREVYTKRYLHRNKLKNTLYNVVKAGQTIAAKLDELEKHSLESAKNIAGSALKYQTLLKTTRIRNWLVEENKPVFPKLIFNLVILVLSFPLFVYGGLFNILPFGIIDRLIRKKVKDINFWSTFFFPLGLILFPLFYLIELILMWSLFPGILLKIAFLISLPVAGKIAFRWYILLRKTIGLFRFLKLKRSKIETIQSLFQLKTEIFEKMDDLIPADS